MENIQKALELHYLPAELAFANGIRTKTVKRHIIMRNTRDANTGKTTTTWHTTERVQPIGTGTPYAFTALRQMMKNSRGVYEGIDENGVATFRVGTDELKKIKPTENGCVINLVPDIAGLVNVSVNREEWYIRRGETTARKGVSSDMWTFVSIAGIIKATGWTEDEIEEGIAQSTYYERFNSETHILNTATDIIEENGRLKGIIYYNGIPSSEIDYRNMYTAVPSADPTKYVLKKHSGFKERWMLKKNHPSDVSLPGSYNAGAWGAIWSVQENAGNLPALAVTESTVNAFDADSYTLEFDGNKKAMLWYQTEELPAQGKNWVVESYRDLNYGINTPTARGVVE